MAKLTQEQWDEARRKYEAGEASYQQLVKEYGISRYAIMRRAKRYEWMTKDRRRTIAHKSAQKAEAALVDKRAIEIEEMDRDIFRSGRALVNVLMKEIGQEDERVDEKKGSATDFNALATAHQKITINHRLQTNRSTSNPQNSGSMTVEVGRIGEVERLRRLRERSDEMIRNGYEFKYGADGDLHAVAPGENPPEPPPSLNVAARRREIEGKAEEIKEAKSAWQEKVERMARESEEIKQSEDDAE